MNRIADPAIAVESRDRRSRGARRVPGAGGQSEDRAARGALRRPAQFRGLRVRRRGRLGAAARRSSSRCCARGPAGGAHRVGRRRIAGPARELRDPARGRVIGRVVEADAALARAALAAASRAPIPPAKERAAILERAADLIEARRARSCWRCSRAKRARRCPTGWARCARRRTSAATTRCSRARDFARSGGAAGPDGRVEPAAPRRARPLRLHQPVEFPARDLRGPGRGRLCRGQRRGRQARRADAARRVPRRGAAARGRDRRARRSGSSRAAARRWARRSSPIRAPPASRFTGSTATAHAINRALAAREGPIVPFIAETGGLNAMLVDSSALPEQVVADVHRLGLQQRRAALLGAAHPVPAGGDRAARDRAAARARPRSCTSATRRASTPTSAR